MIKKKVKIFYHNKEYKIKKFGDWIDLAVAEDVSMSPYEYKMLNLGVSMKLPKHYEASVLPRSSTFNKYGIQLANSEGVIDNAFCGQGDIWRFPALASKHVSLIKKNERIAQFRLQLTMSAPWYVKILDLFTSFEFVEVDVLTDKNRGGLGSTGTK